MRIIREHRDEKLANICYVHETANEEAIAIDESYLAWLYVAPEYAQTEQGQQWLRLALELLGPEAWAMIQTQDAAQRASFEAAGLHIVESFGDEESANVNMHLARVS